MITPLKHLEGDIYQAVALISDEKSPITGRIYSKDEIQSAWDRVSSNTVLGEMDRLVNSDRPVNSDVISLDRVTHEVINCECLPTNEVLVTIAIKPTPLGKIAKILLESDLKLYLSLRSIGKVDSNALVSELDITTFDLVTK